MNKNKKTVTTTISKEQSQNLMKVLYISAIIVIIIYIIILTFIFQLNSQLCQCASNWKKEFIRYYCFYAILKTVIIVYGFSSLYQNKIFNIYKYVDIILFISFVVITLTYIKDLRKNKCLCSQSWKRKLALIYAWIGVGMSGLLLVLGTAFIFMIVIAAYYYQSPNKK